MIANKRLYCPGLLFCGLFFSGLLFLTAPQTALAIARVSGYQLTVTESSSTMTFGETFPSLKAHLTVPADEPVMNPVNFYFLVDNQPDAGSVSGSTPNYTLNGYAETGTTPLSVGNHTIVAAYYSPKLNTIIKSAAITLAVLKSTPQLGCSIANWASTYNTNTSLTITFDFSNTNAPVDWQDATYAIKFEGAQTFTRANLKLNSSEEVTVLTPSVPDNYQLRCIFNGTHSFNAVETASNSIYAIVSENHQVGGIHLYTNPQTVKAGQATTYQVVIIAAPGLPTPTGKVSLAIGSSSTPTIVLGGGGSATFQATAPSPLPGNTIKVFYLGDPIYKLSSATFPLTNPSRPTNQPSVTPGTAGTATPTPGSSVTPTSTASATATGTAIASATSTNTPATSSPTGSRGSGTSGSSASQIPWLWPAILTVVIIGLIGGSTGFFLLRRRAIISRMSTHKYPVIH